MEQFHHEPLDDNLDQIRLVQVIAKTSPSDIISCTISTYDRKTCPTYCALSYAWGAPQPVHLIQLNGQSFEIRNNLHHFLSNIVHDSGLGIDYIWIDQFCIDQTSNSEKNHQVKRMSEIYKEASHVVAWTGFADANEETILEARSMIRSPSAIDDVNSFLHMCRQRYWTRLWIVQELFLARSVKIAYKSKVWSMGDVGRFIDGCRAEYTNLVTTLSWGYFMLTHVPSIYRTNSGFIQDIAVFREPLYDMDYALNNYSDLDCADPRDRVYAVQTIIQESQRIVVDYNKSASEVFVDVLAVYNDVIRAVQDHHREQLADLARGMGVTGCENIFREEQALLLFRRIFGTTSAPKVLRG